MPGFDIQFKFKPNPAAIAKLNGALFRALDETLDIDIQTEAKELSPKKTGTNQRSIATDTQEVGGRVEGSIFTQSGYGGFLEVGTSKMAARPYLWPAVEHHAPKIFERMRRLLR